MDEKRGKIEKRLFRGLVQVETMWIWCQLCSCSEHLPASVQKRYDHGYSRPEFYLSHSRYRPMKWGKNRLEMNRAWRVSLIRDQQPFSSLAVMRHEF